MANQTDIPNYLDKLKKVVYSNKIAVVIIIIILVLSNARQIYENVEFFYLKIFARKRLNKAELKEETLKLAQYLIDFVTERRKYEPDWDWDRREESIRISNDYREETKKIYYQKFYPDLDKIRKEFLKYGISNKMFDQMYKYPTNYLVIEEIAKGLIEMSNEL